MNNYSESKALYERACRVMAGGVASEFRRFSQPHPLFYSHGEGSHIFDADGNDYLDFTLSQGPLILGHSHPHVLDTVRRHSADGQLFAGQHRAELELAERLQANIPCAELLRFSLSGSEANHAALRLARAITARNRFVRFEGHYHGWLDNVALSISPSNESLMGKRAAPHPVPWTRGLPAHIEDECIVLPWNDRGLLEKTVGERHEEIAAVIMEPIMCNSGCIPPEPGYLQAVREICDRYGILLIFDEVITGFRLGSGGAQAHFGVTPDLAVFGKALASGYPISVLAGRRRFMQLMADGNVIHAGTMNSGNPSVAAALATLDVLEGEGVKARLFNLGQRLMAGLKEVSARAGSPFLIQGPGPMFHTGFTSLRAVRDYRDTLKYDKARFAKFVAAMQERGIRLIGRGLWYISAAHTEAEIDQCIAAAGEVLQEMRE